MVERTETSTGKEEIASRQKEIREHILKTIVKINPQEDRRVLFSILKKLEDLGRRNWQEAIAREGSLLLSHNEPIFTSHELLYFETIGAQLGWTNGRAQGLKLVDDLKQTGSDAILRVRLENIETILRPTETGCYYGSVHGKRGDEELEVVLAVAEQYGRWAGELEAKNPEMKVEHLFDLPESLLRTPIDAPLTTSVSKMHSLIDEFKNFEESVGLVRKGDGEGVEEKKELLPPPMDLEESANAIKAVERQAKRSMYVPRSTRDFKVDASGNRVLTGKYWLPNPANLFNPSDEMSR